MTTPAWTARFGPTRWPRMMNAHRYPFLAALTIPNLEHVRLTDNSGAPATVRVDTYQTPYHSFVLLWIPQRRRLVPRRKIAISQ
jgi:hypothetical protein